MIIEISLGASTAATSRSRLPSRLTDRVTTDEVRRIRSAPPCPHYRESARFSPRNRSASRSRSPARRGLCSDSLRSATERHHSETFQCIAGACPQMAIYNLHRSGPPFLISGLRLPVHTVFPRPTRPNNPSLSYPSASLLALFRSSSAATSA